MSDPDKPFDDFPPWQQAFTVAQFCDMWHMSRALYCKLVREGRGPKIMQYGSQPRISRTAIEKWRVQMEKEAESKAAQLERRRRVEIARRAGRAAAASPKHISKQGPRTKS